MDGSTFFIFTLMHTVEPQCIKGKEMMDEKPKHSYLPPTLTVVQFRSEQGFAASGNTTTYGESSNSGDNFWGGTTDETSNTTSYSQYDWNW